ncbi:hypothetical protein [Nocardia fluminea]|uniref:hypothetical protein n=1 Tax=Nocardia fluminea TaxID=134984 RepID=UPI003414AAF8
MVEMAILAAAVCFICYLVLCAVVVIRTGKTAGLRDLAHAMRGLRAVLTLRQ